MELAKEKIRHFLHRLFCPCLYVALQLNFFSISVLAEVRNTFSAREDPLLLILYLFKWREHIQRPITQQKMKFSIKDFSSKCDQIHSFHRIWLHLLKNSLMENFIFYAVKIFRLMNSCSLKHSKFNYVGFGLILGKNCFHFVKYQHFT